MFEPLRVTTHRDGDDLLTAGLGLDGLRAMAPPAFADATAPTPAELRRRALWSNWRGIADLSPAGGYGTLYGSTVAVPGREFQAFATLPGARTPHRVLLQAPDAFDAGKRCLLVTASSGSRGVYGAIAVAGAWGLPRGCAVAYTDKGGGTDYFDFAAPDGVRLDGTRAPAGAPLAFEPQDAAAAGIAFKHAHSRDNPEADWGRHVKQAAEFGLHALTQAYPQQAPFTFDNTRVIAVGISNGGGAVLRAAELEGGWLDAVVAGEPNVYVDAPGARTLYDYATEAALLMPCALPALGLPAAPDVAARCEAAVRSGLIDGADLVAQQRSALDVLHKGGWTDAALRAGALSAGFDLWRAVAAAYASAYGRYGVGAHPCGYRYVTAGSDGPRPPTPAERAAWWSDGSGIPPSPGIALLDPDGRTATDGLQCLRALWAGEGAAAQRVREGVAATRAGLPREGLPMIVVHGTDDGLIPEAFSSIPYVTQAAAAGRDVRHWRVRNAQHFDAFLGLPAYGARYVPLLPYVYRALDRVSAHLDTAAALPANAVIEAMPRSPDQPLDAANLALPY
ncbi:D-(-)-3-hydroxybutyrate oligomer hydrolase [Cognatilysobacter bugurensis]|uniref:D-(-)-3-hydroxybutyrate oligomer hydrolase n=1 Tax=Cognatilysobacter bugurensis TaxID=543356 RepID=A0A918SSX7_9GAMM|nr:D-(-)-3-hydroxybutyrate oligomer hydrolase [Lysobacter bugurensis]GHA70211.1 D-(-)-3-hydroxybutyrate oligomer hydrolase [Lysobacter bugurensis]